VGRFEGSGLTRDRSRHTQLDVDDGHGPCRITLAVIEVVKDRRGEGGVGANPRKGIKNGHPWVSFGLDAKPGKLAC
jgi:hypothetical protein